MAFMSSALLLLTPVIAVAAAVTIKLFARQAMPECKKVRHILPTDELCDDGTNLTGRRHDFDPLLAELDRRDYHSGG
jgi:hypothetical protein